ncbi:hypothetical protein [Priestia flexa]|uniref:hypothetical protein n=1 Tax=Priestia flexa TaxID=86664 RepID=UPI0012683738
MRRIMVMCDNLSYSPLHEKCLRLSKKNNSVLFKLEKYLGKSLMSNEDLIIIRDTILSVSAEISRLPKETMDDKNERL